ncbi:MULTISPECIES: hypothetical protein [Nitrospirillum]|uniref:hypothetical protein n=1 Tax=Nitrospirillum TaxID=1543705 RepID=UPI0011A14739|nr:hypothetical protein [Nitrospirillum amazonense]MEC4589423.1 hypothetical protein [Nitrospirillum amazonense]TWB40036.1 hypothetical protein FBZ91_105271 [Nitrospirillum amazonense]
MKLWSLPEAVDDALWRLESDLRQGRAREDSVQRVVSLIAGLPPQKLVAVGQHVRDALVAVPPAPVEFLQRWLGGAEGEMGLLRATPGLEYLFLFHRDGHLRQAALDKIDQAPPGVFWIAAIAYRQNDWAPAVRAAARRCVVRVATHVGPEGLADAAYFLLARVPTWGRWRLEPHVHPENLFLVRPEMADALAHRIGRAVAGPAGSILRQALRQPYLDGHLPALAVGAVQPIVRMVALHTLIEGQAAWPEGWSREMINKPFNIYRPVRLYATRPVVCPATKTCYLEQAARDRSVVVRRLAAATLAQALGREGAAWEEWEPVLARLERDSDRAIRDRIAFIRRYRAQGRDPLVPFLEALTNGEDFDPGRDVDRGHEVEL